MSMIGDIGIDLRHAFRFVRRRPGVSGISTLVLGTTLGACVVAFSVVTAVFLSPLPFSEPDDLVFFWNGIESSRSDVMNIDSVDELRRRSQHLAAVGAFQQFRAIEDADVPAEWRLARMSPSLLNDVLAVRPIVGSNLSVDEEPIGGPAAVMISYELWRDRFSLDPEVVGRELRLRDQPALVVMGVLPEGFRNPANLERSPDIWMGLRNQEVASSSLYRVFGRLRSGVTLDQARAELAVIESAVVSAGGEAMSGRAVRIERLAGLYGSEQDRSAILMVFGAVVSVFLIGLVNVLAMHLAYLPELQGELALHATLGATSSRIARLLTGNMLMIGAGAAVLGVFLAIATIETVVATLPAAVPRVDEIRVNAVVVVFAAALAFMGTLAIAVISVRQVVNRDLTGALRLTERTIIGARWQRVWRHGLLATQMAVTFALLVVAGLMIRSFWNVTDIDLGYDPDGLVVVQSDLPTGISPLEHSLEAMEALREAGVDGVAVASALPGLLTDGRRVSTVAVDGATREVRGLTGVSSEFFAAMRIPLRAGRVFTPGEVRSGASLAILSEAAARVLFPDVIAIGQSVQLEIGSNPMVAEVVGVAGDVRPYLFVEKSPAVYTTAGAVLREGSGIDFASLSGRSASASTPGGYIVIRTGRPVSDIVDIIAGIREGVVVRAEGMDARIASSHVSWRFRAIVLGGFAGVAILLAATGVYTTLTHSVRRQTREIGVRMSLGAQRAHVFVQVLSGVLPASILALPVGLMLGFGISGGLTAYLFGLQRGDIGTYVWVACGMIAVVILAAAIPAARASRIDPLRALRHE